MKANTRVATLELENKRLKKLLDKADENNWASKTVILDKIPEFAGLDNFIDNFDQPVVQESTQSTG